MTAIKQNGLTFLGNTVLIIRILFLIEFTLPYTDVYSHRFI